MQLQLACLNYGSSSIPVKSTPDLPLPETFDFDNPVECSKLVFACMSNASGGFRLRDCKVRYNLEHKTANLTAIGVHVYYAVPDAPKLAFDEALLIHANSIIVELGDVQTDQYGGGWERAVWMPSEKLESVAV